MSDAIKPSQPPSSTPALPKPPIELVPGHPDKRMTMAQAVDKLVFDGAHIASLLITFFYQEMPELIENGHLFLAVPPLYSLKHGQPTSASFASLCSVVAAQEFDLHIHLNLGKSSATIYTADLTEKYVDFNKGDVTDPSSLGG